MTRPTLLEMTHCPRGLAFSTYAARLSASSCRSQLDNRFQLVKMLTSLRSRSELLRELWRAGQLSAVAAQRRRWTRLTKLSSAL